MIDLKSILENIASIVAAIAAIIAAIKASKAHNQIKQTNELIAENNGKKNGE